MGDLLTPEFESPRPRCKTCVHFEAMIGECRAHAPTIVGQTQQGMVAGWPATRAEKWCGEHKLAVVIQ